MALFGLIFGIFLGYLCGCFIALRFDPRFWMYNLREGVVILMIVLGTICALFAFAMLG